MTPKLKAEDLINSYRIILMNENTECGNEILCTSIAKQNALITVSEILQMIDKDEIDVWDRNILIYWKEVKKEIEKL